MVLCQNHRGMPLCGYLLFRPETVKYLRSRCASTNQRQNGSRQPYLIFVFIYIYDEDARAYWRIFNLKGVLMLQIRLNFF